MNPVCSKTEVMPAFQLKGGLYTLTVLQLLGTDLIAFERQLNSKLREAPKFFKNAPLIIDLQKLKNNLSVDFKHLKEILLKNFLIPVGIKGGELEQQTEALLAGIPILQDNTRDRALENNNEITEDQPPVETKPSSQETFSELLKGNSKLITEPVRSGQQIYAQGGDLIILSAVSHGAELLADGHIHVYGPLRGRALAGVNGDTTAHIFCQNLEAELISIAGQYKISEDIEPSAWGSAVNIYLAGEHLHISPL